ncbi:hypothetical protein JAAARDRAFT_615540 [Jaapia argillacea MUCL 33604]|uniref:Uncharacterized protein n=1 Tax=Jaapia argillacea MUCL 33604 TaxID=933084 RepID=A0A067P7E4_9AGAM|nr:hypothetical protein JAAARDRAFT_615540 [Jaapia argillacea MUCL 33604]
MSRNQLDDKIKRARRSLRSSRAKGTAVGAQAQATLDTLLARQNSQAPISRLPYELLRKILVHSVVHVYHEPGISTKLLRWTAISHVCRYWREISLDCVEVWTRLLFRSPELTQMMISRSKTALIHINASLIARFPRPARTRLEAVQLALQRSEKIRSIDLEAPYEAMRKLVGVMRLPAPNLHWLSLCVHPYFGSFTRWNLPTNLFNGQVPNLRRLRVRGYDIHRDSPLFTPNLTHLEVDLYKRSVSTLSIRQLLSLLERFPRLEGLVLKGVITVADDSEALELPHLASLHIEDTLSHCIQLTDVLRFPPEARVMLDCTAAPTGPSIDWHPLFSVIANRLGYPERVDPFHSMQVWAEEQLVRLRLWLSEDIDDRYAAWGEWSPPKIAISVTVASLSQFLHAAFESFPLHGLRSLSLAPPAQSAQDWAGWKLTTQDWMAFFLLMPSLQTVRVRSVAERHLVEALLPRRSHPTTKGKSEICLLGLEMIILDQVMIDGGFDSIFMDQLSRYLVARAALGSPIKELHFRNCMVGQQTIKRVGEHVDKVLRTELPESSPQVLVDEGGFWDRRTALFGDAREG